MATKAIAPGFSMRRAWLMLSEFCNLTIDARCQDAEVMSLIDQQKHNLLNIDAARYAAIDAIKKGNAEAALNILNEQARYINAARRNEDDQRTAEAKDVETNGRKLNLLALLGKCLKGAK